MPPSLRSLSSRIALVFVVSALGLACASSKPPASVDSGNKPQPTASTDPAADTRDVADATAQAQKAASKGTLQRHAESGMESMIIGTVIGGQVFGQYGAAVGALTFGLYGLLTGDVPFETGAGTGSSARPGRSSGPYPDSALEDEIEEELGRQDALENEIEEELKRQEELLASISTQEAVNQSIRSEHEQRSASEDSGDPLAAPQAPYERRIPESIFDTKHRKEGKQQQLVKTLDADRDGRPEIEMVFDERSGALLTRSDDTDYDGQLDTVNRYEHGKIVERIEDTNHDGEPDRWITYENEKGSRMEVDRDFDGTPDAFYVYADETLSYEEHDTNGDGKIDRRVEFEDRHRSIEREDRDHDGKLEFQTFYNKKEVPVRTEQDTNGDGKTDVWEFYEGKDPAKIVLVRKEEDVNADGNVDITSYYKKGKLTRKEVEDPDLLLQ